MTLNEAREIAAGVIGEIVYTPESLVRRFMNSVCLEPEPDKYQIWGDGILLAESYNPDLAWMEAAENLPSFVLNDFEVERVDYRTIFYRKKEVKGEEESRSCEACCASSP